MNANHSTTQTTPMVTEASAGTLNEIMSAVIQPSALYDQFAKSLNAHDLAGVMSLFDANGVTVAHPSMPVITGMQGIKGVMEQCLAMRPQIRYEDTSIILADDIALLRSNWSLTVNGADGKPTELKGKGIQVVRQQADGSWRILIDNPWCAE